MLRSLAVFAALGALTGCAARHAPPDAITSIRFEGNIPPEGLDGVLATNNDRALRTAMFHPKPRRPAFFLPVEAAPLDRDLLDQDAWRLEVWYADRGWFDARFVGWELQRDGGDDEHRRWALVGHVDQGQPSRVRAVRIEGIDALTAPLRARLKDSLALAEGDIYATLAWQEARDGLVGLLRERGYAYAQVETDVAAHPGEHAVDVVFKVTTGPACRFGPVTFSRTPGIPKAALQDAIPIKEGQPYRASQVAVARDKLFALRVFSVVNVEPDLSDPSRDVVPVQVTLRKGRTREVSVGPELVAETSKVAALATAQGSDDNVGARLWRLEGEARAGAAVIRSVVGTTDDATQVWSAPAPVGAASLSLTLPRVPSPRFTLGVEGSVEADVLPGYSFVQPELQPTLAWQVDKRLALRASYRLQYFQLLSGSVDLSEILDAPRGVDPNAPYFLSVLQQGIVYDGRNDPVRTTRGGYWELQFAEAGGPLGGVYGFLRGTGEVRAYRSLTRILGWDPDAVLAGRLAGGLIWSGNGSDVEVVPVKERLYLGGGTSVRGWAADRLGPWEEVLNDAGEPEVVPIGGMLRLQGNLEARKRLPYDVDVAAFVDAGRAWRQWSDATPASVQVSVGGGLRYATSIGPIRVDLARRLGQDERFDFYPRWAVHFGLSEAF